MHIPLDNEFLRKHFEISADGNVTCRNIDTPGISGALLMNIYTATYNTLKTEAYLAPEAIVYLQNLVTDMMRLSYRSSGDSDGAANTASAVPEEILLHDEDFPENYVNMSHPDDYKITRSFKPQFIVSRHENKHTRLIARVAWKLSDQSFIPMSFVCDTGAPGSFYLSPTAMAIMKSVGKVLSNDMNDAYTEVLARTGNRDSFTAVLDSTPRLHRNANIIGLKVMMKLGFSLSQETFSLGNNLEHL